MIDFEAVIHLETLLLHRHGDVLKVLRAYVKITWYSVQLKVAFKATALLLIEFRFRTCS